MRHLQTFAHMVGLLLLIGCSSEEPRWAVKGKVSLDGIPLKEGTIFFENKEKGIALSAPIGADGVYLVASYKGAGLPQGTYVVSVSPSQTLTSADQIPLVGKTPLPPKDVSGSPIPLKYRSSESSDIQIEVKVGINPSFDINLKREP